jgi:hypothetical protein
LRHFPATYQMEDVADKAPDIFERKNVGKL